MKKSLILTRTAIILFYAVCLILLIHVLVKNPLKNNVYGFKLHDSAVFCCPSCGLTRAVYCLFTLKIKSAFYYHAFFTVFSPVIAYVMLTLTVNLFACKKVIPYPKRYGVYLWVLFGLWMAFTVIRNLTPFIF